MNDVSNAGAMQQNCNNQTCHAERQRRPINYIYKRSVTPQMLRNFSMIN